MIAVVTGLVAACGARTGLPAPSDLVTPESDAGTDAPPDAPPPQDASVGPICTPSLAAGSLASCSWT